MKTHNNENNFMKLLQKVPTSYISTKHCRVDHTGKSDRLVLPKTAFHRELGDSTVFANQTVAKQPSAIELAQNRDCLACPKPLYLLLV